LLAPAIAGSKTFIVGAQTQQTTSVLKGDINIMRIRTNLYSKDRYLRAEAWFMLGSYILTVVALATAFYLLRHRLDITTSADVVGCAAGCLFIAWLSYLGTAWVIGYLIAAIDAAIYHLRANPKIAC
jgi:hypothetical protein